VSHDYSIYYSIYHDDSEAHAHAMALAVTELLRDDLPADRSARILDLGCGYGFALRALRSLGFSALQGMESSQQQAERARAAGFTVDVADDSAAWLRTREARFDCVLLLDVLEHVPVAAQIDLLRAIHLALAPGGRLIVTTPNANAILAARWRYNDHTHHASFTEHSLYYVLRNALFDPITIDAGKGIGRFPRRLWRRSSWPMARRWIVRWCWLQVFKAEVPWEDIDKISFELNLKAVAGKP
jgi:2-polyprenyl-3-methyl-5-hydroxy-6-metoxy-1,4-benzoquinol methylase